MEAKAYVEITMCIVGESNRKEWEGIFKKNCEPFLKTLKGAVSLIVLERENDIQVLHGFDSMENAMAYLDCEMIKNGYADLKPIWIDEDHKPDERVYEVVCSHIN